MLERCMVAGRSKVTYVKNGISLHQIHFFNDERPEAKRRRRKWIEFINRKRAKWLPSRSSVVCSVHFMPEDFPSRFAVLPELNDGLQRRLTEDDIGVMPVPSIYVKGISKPDVSSSKARRDRRMIGYFPRFVCIHFLRMKHLFLHSSVTLQHLHNCDFALNPPRHINSQQNKHGFSSRFKQLYTSALLSSPLFYYSC